MYKFRKGLPIDAKWDTNSRGAQMFRDAGIIGTTVSRETASQQVMGRTGMVDELMGGLRGQLEQLMHRQEMDGRSSDLANSITAIENKISAIMDFMNDIANSAVSGRRPDGSMLTASELEEERQALQGIRYRGYRALRHRRAEEAALEKQYEDEEKRREREEAKRLAREEKEKRRRDAHAERAYREMRGMSWDDYVEGERRADRVSDFRFDIRSARVDNKLGNLSEQQSDAIMGMRPELRDIASYHLGEATRYSSLGNMPAAQLHLGRAAAANNAAAESMFIGNQYFHHSEIAGGQEMVMRARYQRSLTPQAIEPSLWQRLTGQMPNQPKRGPLDDDLRGSLTKESERLAELAADYMSKAESETDSETRKLLLDRGMQASGLSNQMVRLLSEGNENTKSTLNKAMDFIAKTVGLFGVSQVLSRTMIQEPYQFRTRPALDVMGNQGEVGQLLSSAYGELEQHKVGLNQMGLGMGTSIAMAGMAAGGVGGAALGALGGVIGLTGVTGVFDDLWMNSVGTSEEEILGQSLAKQLMNPERLVSEFVGSRAGLMAHGALDLDNFGYGDIEGNAAHKEIRDRLLPLGFSNEEIGQMLSQSSLSIRGDSRGLTSLSGEMFAAFGVDPSSVIGAGASAQRAGLSDAEATYRQALGVTATEDGPTSFTANILVPALMKVVESSAVQNLARNSEELKDEIFGLQGAMLGSTQTNLGNLAKANPQVLAQMYSSITQSIQSATGDPARMAHLLNNYTSTDIMFGRMSVMEGELGRMLQGRSLDDFRGADPFGMNRDLHEEFRALFPGMSYQGANELFKLYLEHGSLSAAGVTQDAAGNYIDAEGNIIGGPSDDELKKRIEAIVGSEVGELYKNMAAQANIVLETSRTFTNDMLDVQNGILEFIAGDKILELASSKIEEIVNIIKDLNGVREPVDPGDAANFSSRGEGRRRDSLDEWATNAVEGIGGIDFSGVGNFFKNMFTRPMSVPSGSGGRSIGGFTGLGATHQVAGVVHAEEYVISQNNVRDNREVLDAIQSGRKLSDVAVRNRGGTTYVSLRVTGADPESIYQLAEKAAERYITRNRLQYA